jgi:hypothetical protein
MSKIRKVRTVFIASPSDLAEERKKAFEVAADVNKLFKRSGLSIDLLDGRTDSLVSGVPKLRSIKM